MANYCPECGHRLEAAVLDDAIESETEVEVAEVREDSAVRIAEIEAEKAIALAKINAGLYKDEAVAELAVEAAHADGEASGLREALTPPEPEVLPVPASAPVTVVNDNEPTMDVEEPPDSKPAPPAPKKSSGFWG